MYFKNMFSFLYKEYSFFMFKWDASEVVQEF